MDLAACRYVVVEGPIGVGKTSLASRLAERLQAGVLLERPEENPFLPRFYRDMARYALPTQLNFLFQRLDQVRGLEQLDLFAGPTVADFLLDKDPLFARLTLSEDEFRLYDRIYTYLRPQVATPDLVIYLQARTATLAERVQRRAMDYERTLGEAYLERLAQAYSRFFYQYDEAPVLIVNSEQLDFVDEPGHLDLLLERVAAMRGRREFFNFVRS